MAGLSRTSLGLRLAFVTIVYCALLFLLAGTTRWPEAWAYLALVIASLFVYSMILVRLHPDLIDERARPPADAKKWDKPFVAVVGGLGPTALLVICGLDRRFRWTAPFPAWMTFAGFLTIIAGHVLTNCAVAANRFFSAFVRIQRDRGHRVIDSGPYRLVRHPGYLGSILHMFGTGLALGSVWALDVAAVLSLVLAVRTWLEDRTLRTELEGYAAYAGRVRFRLLPGVW